MDEELEVFKREINLVEYANAQGYEVDQRESSRASVVMRMGGDKVVIATGLDGHSVYFSVRDDGDNGSIIDFVQRRRSLNLGQVRKELRPWVTPATSSSYRPGVTVERVRKPEPSTADRQQVLAVWLKMQPIGGGHFFLESERMLSRTTLADPRFSEMMRIDQRFNAVFPHYDRQGLAGFELKNKGFTGFSKHGIKAVWHSANLFTAPRVVIVESAIDGMSHAQLAGDLDTAYLSTGGSMSDHQRDLVRSALVRADKRGAEIVLGTDADEAGRKLAEQLQELAVGVRMLRHEPTDGKDWNDALRISVSAGVMRSPNHGFSPISLKVESLGHRS